MSRLFNGTTQYLSNANAIVTAPPFTMACWFKLVNVAVNYALLSSGISGANTNRYALAARGDIAGDPIRALSQDGGAAAVVDTSTGYTANIWQHATGVWAATNSRTAWLNGGGNVTETTSKTISGNNSFYIGATHNVAVGSFASGAIAEAGIWNVALNTSEIAALAAGVSPLRIRPNALVSYWPLFGVGSPEPDYSNGGFLMTLNNAPTQADHAPVMPAFFRADWYGAFGAAAAVTGHSLVLSDNLSNRIFGGFVVR